MRGNGWLFSAVKANDKMKADKMTERFGNKNRSYQLNKYASSVEERCDAKDSCACH